MHCVFAGSLLIVSYVQDALRKELLMISFIERFKQLLLGSLTDKFYHYLKNSLKHCIFTDLLVIVSYVRGHSTERVTYCSFRRTLQNNSFGKVPLITFTSTLKKMPKQIFSDIGLSTGCSAKEAAPCSFRKTL